MTEFKNFDLLEIFKYQGTGSLDHDPISQLDQLVQRSIILRERSVGLLSQSNQLIQRCAAILHRFNELQDQLNQALDSRK
jgi:hypothetical protein